MFRSPWLNMQNNWERTMKMRNVFILLVVVALACTSCGKRQPLPQPRKVADPSMLAGAVNTPDWDLAAVAYEYTGQGINYLEAGVLPVFVIFKNKSAMQPDLKMDEARGVAPGGEYLPYSLQEAERLIFDSEAFANTASNVARTGSIGAIAGAGLGALIGLVGGGDNIWKGAVIGGTIGAGAGGIYGGVGSEDDLKKAVREDLAHYSWSDVPVPADYTKVGYAYLPNNVGITALKVVVRTPDGSKTYTLPFSK